jgi:hypothetical protein
MPYIIGVCQHINGELSFTNFYFYKEKSFCLGVHRNIRQGEPISDGAFYVEPEVLGFDSAFFDTMYNLRNAFEAGSIPFSDLRTFQENQHTIVERLRKHCETYGHRII